MRSQMMEMMLEEIVHFYDNANPLWSLLDPSAFETIEANQIDSFGLSWNRIWI